MKENEKCLQKWKRIFKYLNAKIYNDDLVDGKLCNILMISMKGNGKIIIEKEKEK